MENYLARRCYALGKQRQKKPTLPPVAALKGSSKGLDGHRRDRARF